VGPDGSLLLLLEPPVLVCRPSRRGLMEEALPLVARLKNVGTSAVTLVSPGDGSRMGRRPPTISWVFDPGGSLQGFEGCGNITSLNKGDVFSLEPGRERVLQNGWISPLVVPKVPRCRAVMVYTNVPEQDFRGVLLAPHDGAELLRLRASHACRVTSNEVELVMDRPPSFWL
jgi:hypothetical protein